MKLYLGLGLIFLGVFSFASGVSAYFIQPDYSSSQNYWTLLNYTVESDAIAAHEPLTTLRIRLADGSDDDNATCFEWYVNAVTAGGSSQSSTETISVTGVTEFTWSSGPYTDDLTQINIVPTGVCDDNNFNILGKTGSGTDGIHDGIFEAYMEINDAQYTVQLKDPPHTDNVITTDFDHFRFCVNSSVEFETAQVVLQYGETFSGHEDESDEYDFEATGERCDTKAKTNSLVPGDYVARANLYIDGNPFSSSETWHFRVVEGENSFYPIGIGTTGEVSEPDEYCTNGNFLVSGICKLFVPNFSTLSDDWGGTETILADKIPFSYFYSLKDQFSEISTNDASFQITIPMAVAGWEQDMTVLNTSDTDVRNVLDMGRPWLEAFMWISFGWFALTRVFHIDL